MSKLKGRLGTETLPVEVEENATDGSYTLRVGDREENLVAPEDGSGDGTYLLDGRPFDVRILSIDGERKPLVNGRLLDVDARHPLDGLVGGAAAGGVTDGREEIRSPMPGKVVSILVAIGDAVEPGQTVAIVEAMKMQNELQASIAGIVREIKSEDGATVDSGAPLLVIEAEEEVES